MSSAAALAAGESPVAPTGGSASKPRRRGAIWEPSALLFVGPSVLLALAWARMTSKDVTS